MKDFLTFRHMLMPWLIQLSFWVISILCICAAILDFWRGMFITGLGALILGPIITRLVCEFFILFFRMNETLTEIKNTLSKSENPSSHI